VEAGSQEEEEAVVVVAEAGETGTRSFTGF
jgi:hypothetical protein